MEVFALRPGLSSQLWTRASPVGRDGPWRQDGRPAACMQGQERPCSWALLLHQQEGPAWPRTSLLAENMTQSAGSCSPM